MNTRIEIQVISNNSPEFVKTVLYEAYSQFDGVVNKFSRFDRRSELSKLNSSGGKWHRCTKELFDLVEFSLEIAHRTEGKFDPTIIDILESYGYDSKDTFSSMTIKGQLKGIDKNANSNTKPNVSNAHHIDIRNAPPPISQRPSFSKIEVDRKNHKVKLQPNQRIDLGAIGKGYAIDLAYEVLQEKFDNFMINAGGDIRVKGTNANGDPWKIKLGYTTDNSDGENYIGFVELVDGSICCSGGFARKIGNFHHLIDPKTASPSNKTTVSYVYAKSAILADTFSTVSYLIGKDIEKIQNDFSFEFLVLTEDKELILSAKFPFQK